MDVAGIAQQQVDLNLKVALSALNHCKPEHTGTCKWCSGKIKQGGFCDTDCIDDFEKSKIMKNN